MPRTIIRSRPAADSPSALSSVPVSAASPTSSPIRSASPMPIYPGFPVSKVSAHKNELIAGTIENVPIVVLSGRAHYFEAGDAAAMRTPIGTLRALGCDTLILTNAAGSLQDRSRSRRDHADHRSYQL